MGAGYAFEKVRVVVHNILYGKEKVFDPKRVPVIFFCLSDMLCRKHKRC
jgi:dihydrolipoamide dehydrogenase